MGSYFSDRWEALQGLPAAIAQNPVFFIIVFAIGLPLIWWKWKVTGDSTVKAVNDLTHGLRADAAQSTTRHDTGIGTKDILVMRPAPLSKMIYFALFFFGGGALFYIFVHMPSDRAVASDWWTALGLAGFAVISMIAIELNQTRIIVDGESLEKRRVLHRRQKFNFADIETVEPLGKDFTRGLSIRTKSGEKMRVTAGFSGYRQLMERLAPHKAELALLVKLLKSRANARTARG